MKIETEIKPKDQMRYDTVGDYYFLTDGTLKFEVADSGNPLYNWMVLIHEMTEFALLEHRGIPVQTIDEFDMMYEKEREQNFHDIDDEPGFDNRSPYREEHTLATAVEMMICAHAGISWMDYNEVIITL